MKSSTSRFSLRRRPPGRGDRTELLPSTEPRRSAAGPGAAIPLACAVASNLFLLSVGAPRSAEASCSITSAANQVYGAYNPGSGTALTPNSNVVVTCTVTTTFTIGLNYGLHVTGTQRRMILTSTFLDYDFYTDSTRTVPWLAQTQSLTTSGTTPKTVTVYGRLPTGQWVTPGAYADTVTVTVTY